MAKKKTQKPVQQLLSPENYIRQKSRKLPLYNCLVSAGWDEHGMAQIFVARQHANGNISFGGYLVDLYCLGVKDAFFKFNCEIYEFDEVIADFSDGMTMISVDYALVHNIIYASVAYAAELGFKPCKDFSETAKYILEEDTDEVELMEIECGKDGKPLFVKTDLSNDIEANRIIQQLEKSVGKGNFDVLYVDGWDDEDDNENSEYDELDLQHFDEYNAMTALERRNAFTVLISDSPDQKTDNELSRLVALTECIFEKDLTDDAEIIKLHEAWNAELEMVIDEEEYTAVSLGLSPRHTLTDEDIEEFTDLDAEYFDEEKDDDFDEEIRAEEIVAYKKLKQKWGDIPYLCYWDLKYDDKLTKAYKSKLKKYNKKYPDYALLKIEMLKSMLLDEEYIKDKNISFKSIFRYRSSITELEMFEYQLLKILDLVSNDSVNIMALKAEYIFLDSIDLDPNYVQSLKTLLLTTKVSKLQDYFQEKVDSN